MHTNVIIQVSIREIKFEYIGILEVKSYETREVVYTCNQHITGYFKGAAWNLLGACYYMRTHATRSL